MQMLPQPTHKASQPPARADVAPQARITLFLVLPQLGALEEVHLVQVLVVALLVRLQLILHLHMPVSNCTHSASAIQLKRLLKLLACWLLASGTVMHQPCA
jgi:hypothetical protein